ncbi:hypothetical protein ACFV0B_11235 [Streptomyces xanthophaeus]|uniref:zinc finger domain-containing protein n=1 Tax=Streptomyces xanthophaeus TaxID=67385 RepID=UPI0036A66C46
MNQPRSAPMPASLRAGRPARHPALAVRCPHCSAAEGARCTTISGRHTKTAPCPARLAAHATAVAVCPDCQVAPGTECRTDEGQPLHDIHPARHIEAGGTAA